MKNESSLKILAVGNNEAIMNVLERLINSHSGWTGTIALSVPEAQEKMRQQSFDALLICVGVSPEEEQTLQEYISKAGAATKIIRHYGGGSGLLENEIRTAFES